MSISPLALKADEEESSSTSRRDTFYVYALQ